MAERRYDRESILWEMEELERRKAQGTATSYPNGNWVVQLIGGGQVAVRPEQITFDGMTGDEWAAEDSFRAAAEAERGYERWLETRYHDVMMWEEEQERRMF